MSDIMSHIGPAEVLFIRNRLNLTQQQLAEKVGVQRTSVTLWETGDRNPSGSAAILLEKLRKTAVSKRQK